MKAIVYQEYGLPDVLRLEEVEKPTPEGNHVLVKVHAASLNQFDWHLLTADIFLVRFSNGLRKPKRKILGADIAGRVESVGRNVTQYRPGDEVYGDVSGSGIGGFAEYVLAPETVLAPKPANLSFEEAAAVPMAGVTALQGLRDKGRLQPGEKVLINGASGGVGTFAVQIAKALGAEVTAVVSSGKAEQAKSIGADHVIDYTREDFTHNGRRYDLILGVNGFRPLSEYRRALTANGRYVMAGGSTPQLFQGTVMAPLASMRGGQRMGHVAAKPNQRDLLTLKELLEARKVVPVIDRRYPLSQVPDALRYLGEGHARGKVVITVVD